MQEAFHREYIRPRRYPWFVPTILPDHAGDVYKRQVMWRKDWKYGLIKRRWILF